jgi:hypothetical protein
VRRVEWGGEKRSLRSQTKARSVLVAASVRLLHKAGHNTERRVFAGFLAVKRNEERTIYTVLPVVNGATW